MHSQSPQLWKRGEVITLRYISTDARIEMCWPCRVVTDSEESLVTFIAAGSKYMAGPKLDAAEKRRSQRSFLPPNEYEWRKDTLRIFQPGQCHSVFLFWTGTRSNRRFEHYFVNLEEPFRRTPIGIDTQDHTLDIVVEPDLTWQWRDEEELERHVQYGFYTRELAGQIRAEGTRAISAISNKTHPCMRDWDSWLPDRRWTRPDLPAGWATTPITFWHERQWAYGNDHDRKARERDTS